MDHEVVWETNKRCVFSAVKFGPDGPVFHLRVSARAEGGWVWSTCTSSATPSPSMFNLGGETDLGEAEGRRLAEEAIALVAEDARAWHQDLADSFRAVTTKRTKPPATPMPGEGVLNPNG